MWFCETNLFFLMRVLNLFTRLRSLILQINSGFVSELQVSPFKINFASLQTSQLPTGILLRDFCFYSFPSNKLHNLMIIWMNFNHNAPFQLSNLTDLLLGFEIQRMRLILSRWWICHLCFHDIENEAQGKWFRFFYDRANSPTGACW